MSAFQVIERPYQGTRGVERVILDTDDWVEAQKASLAMNWPKDASRHIRGLHPTHEWLAAGTGRQWAGTCSRCKRSKVGYAAQLPCGTDLSLPLVTLIKREELARVR